MEAIELTSNNEDACGWLGRPRVAANKWIFHFLFIKFTIQNSLAAEIHNRKNFFHVYHGCHDYERTRSVYERKRVQRLLMRMGEGRDE